MDEELAAILASAHGILGMLEGIVIYMPDKEAIQELLLLKESYYSKLIDYPCSSFYDILAGKTSAWADMAGVASIAMAYRHSLGKVFENQTLSDICKIALYGSEAEAEIEIRKKQTFLSNVVTNLKQYNPTAPDHILPAIADISAFLHGNETTDILIKVALTHYQFEMVHPYECYNGIVGRITVPLLLWDSDYKSALYIGLSEFLYRNKNEYFDKLSSTQWSGNYNHWIKFFVKGIYEAATVNIKKIERFQQIAERDKEKLESFGSTGKSIRMIHAYFRHHLISEIRAASLQVGMSFNTVAKSVTHLLELGILQLESEQLRHRRFVYKRLVDIFNEETTVYPEKERLPNENP
jgi:Fic family protein